MEFMGFYSLSMERSRIYHMAATDKTREERMATESIGKLMASMTLPAILAQIINILYSIIDRIYIGHMEGVGANALTGVGVTFCITVFISAFSNGPMNKNPPGTVAL